MKTPQAFRRALTHRRARGQMIILAAVALLALALVVLITFNVTVAVQQRIKLQNYADTKAFSMAVAEARTLNYLAYTNRAIASAYVGMANVHAYVSEAAQLSDLKAAAAIIMAEISAEELEQCFCCWGPCCFQHCIDSGMADVNVIGLGIDYISGTMGSSLQAVDGPASDTVDALGKHITALHLSQTASKVAVGVMLGAGTFGNLKTNNMQLADSVTSDETLVKAVNLLRWNSVFSTDDDVKKSIMAETANASRQNFAWNRSGNQIMGYLPPTPVLFGQLSSHVPASLWLGPDGTWIVTQIPDAAFTASGRTGFADSGFKMGFGGDVATGTGNQGKVVSSFDWGTLEGVWKHGAGIAPLPTTGPFLPPRLTTGQSGNEHSGGFIGDFFNNPHSGDHSMDLDMTRFEEFNIDTNFPYNQPSVFSSVSTDTRVNEYGQRGPWEVAKDGSGTLTVKKVGPTDAKITLSNNNRSKAVAKAMVYYHRIGDWSDYPNMFNPYWRAKLHPFTRAELATVVAPLDNAAAQVAGAASLVNGGSVNVE
jgi:hypothetical protein